MKSVVHFQACDVRTELYAIFFDVVDIEHGVASVVVGSPAWSANALR